MQSLISLDKDSNFIVLLPKSKQATAELNGKVYHFNSKYWQDSCGEVDRYTAIELDHLAIITFGDLRKHNTVLELF